MIPFYKMYKYEILGQNSLLLDKIVQSKQIFGTTLFENQRLNSWVGVPNG